MACLCQRWYSNGSALPGTTAETAKIFQFTFSWTIIPMPCRRFWATKNMRESSTWRERLLRSEPPILRFLIGIGIEPWAINKLFSRFAAANSAHDETAAAGRIELSLYAAGLPRQ